jgi:4-amino-4-deoxy-L-arabinose transferase-like glycosyltransferase
MPTSLFVAIHDIGAERATGFWVAMVLMAVSLLLFHRGQIKPSLFLMVASAFTIGLFMAMLDPFLWMWDEQYHALVAKNMLLDPLKPTLYHSPALPYEFWLWTNNHVWLHKQPLFLWQMAASIKLFGTNELAVRLPSVVMHALVPLMIYRIGRLVISRSAGFYAAMLFVFANYPLELITGLHATDHNDIAFLFYTCASIWAWVEHHRSGSWKWAISAGLFAGFAILVKWLAGLLVFGIWGLAALVTSDDVKAFFVKMKFLTGAFLLCAAVALPWQLHIHNSFPTEAGHELAMMHEHFSHVVEGHGGDVTYHFDKGLKKIYGSGDLIAPLLLLGLLLLLFRTWDRGHRYGLIAGVVVVYGFYSMAATKMTGFTLIVAPIVFLGLGTLSDTVLKLVSSYLPTKTGNWFRTLVIGMLCIAFLDVGKVSREHADELHAVENGYHARRITGRNLGKHLAEVLDRPHIVFNTGVDHGAEIQVMFSSDHVAYGRMPRPGQLETARTNLPDMPIAVVSWNNESLPAHITENGTIAVVHVSL